MNDIGRQCAIIGGSPSAVSDERSFSYKYSRPLHYGGSAFVGYASSCGEDASAIRKRSCASSSHSNCAPHVLPALSQSRSDVISSSALDQTDPNIFTVQYADPSLSTSSLTPPPHSHAAVVDRELAAPPPLSVLLLSGSSPTPTVPKQTTPTPVLSAVQHASPLSQDVTSSEMPRIDPKEYYYPLSPKLVEEYPPELMLWRDRVRREPGLEARLSLTPSLHATPSTIKAQPSQDHALDLKQHFSHLEVVRSDLAANSMRNMTKQHEFYKTESRFHRGKLLGMDAAQQARLNAQRTIRVEQQLHGIFRDESLKRAQHEADEIHSRNEERELFQVVLNQMYRRQFLAKEADFRGLLEVNEREEMEALSSFEGQCRTVSERRCVLRLEMISLVLHEEPWLRKSLLLCASDEWEQWRAGERREYYDILLDEVAADEQRERDLFYRFLSEKCDILELIRQEALSTAQRNEWARKHEALYTDLLASLLDCERQLRYDLEEALGNDLRQLIDFFYSLLLWCNEREEFVANESHQRSRIEVEREIEVSTLEACFTNSEHDSQLRTLQRLECDERADIVAEASLALSCLEREQCAELEECIDRLQRRLTREEDERRRFFLAAMRQIESECTDRIHSTALEEQDQWRCMMESFLDELTRLDEQRAATEQQRIIEAALRQQSEMASDESHCRQALCDEQGSQREVMCLRFHMTCERIIIGMCEHAAREMIEHENATTWSKEVMAHADESLAAALRQMQLREAAEAQAVAALALRQRAERGPPFLGFSLAEKISPNISSSEKRLLATGLGATLVVDSLVINGPAYNEGLRLHDRIVSVGGFATTSLIAVRQAIAKNAKVGQKFEVVVRRHRSIESGDSGENLVNMIGSVSDASSEAGGEELDTFTFLVPVKTVGEDFASIDDLYFDMSLSQKVERENPTPGFATRRKRAYSEKLGASPLTTSTGITSGGNRLRGLSTASPGPSRPGSVASTPAGSPSAGRRQTFACSTSSSATASLERQSDRLGDTLTGSFAGTLKIDTSNDMRSEPLDGFVAFKSPTTMPIVDDALELSPLSSPGDAALAPPFPRVATMRKTPSFRNSFDAQLKPEGPASPSLGRGASFGYARK